MTRQDYVGKKKVLTFKFLEMGIMGDFTKYKSGKFIGKPNCKTTTIYILAISSQVFLFVHIS
jgi:hypothetical protein